MMTHPKALAQKQGIIKNYNGWTALFKLDLLPTRCWLGNCIPKSPLVKAFGGLQGLLVDWTHDVGVVCLTHPAFPVKMGFRPISSQRMHLGTRLALRPQKHPESPWGISLKTIKASKAVGSVWVQTFLKRPSSQPQSTNKAVSPKPYWPNIDGLGVLWRQQHHLPCFQASQKLHQPKSVYTFHHSEEKYKCFRRSTALRCST